ncbi:nucleoside-specific channel-forming protein [Pseudomonas sp. Z003-0.4C(8344-21)]|uniref:nucleoside-specific channel-forming protein Tsx n=1 Tax=Pseudomonas TaxID=286 RepID=UPI00087B2C4A|nr:nucleoside-specific channel-forming protein Tsx [Pseudomonas sp. Z003-0.4C(8344-21)]SDS74953.1 nucleoside-specific channel-forming protein [Pseudomonas sp. Z003-0.4C(8344-21)]
MHFASSHRAPFLRTCAVSLLLTGVTGFLSHSAYAQPAPAEESAQGESLSPEASPPKKGAYLSDWYNQDLTLIGSKDISFGPQPADDIYLEYEYFGRKGPFELYGYIDVPKIFNIGNSHDKGVWDHGSPVFMEHEPRISIDYLAGRSLAIGPFKEWYVAFDWIYDHGSRKENRANTLYSGLGTDIDTHSRVNLSANLYGRYQWENYGASNEYSWDGYRAQLKYIIPIDKFSNGASLTYIGFTNFDFGSDLHKDDPARTANATVATNVLLYSFTHVRFTLVGRYFHNGGNWDDGSELNFGDGNFRARSNGWGYYAGIGYQF